MTSVTNISYQSLNSADYLPAKIRECDAEKTYYPLSGKRRWRLCFKDASLDKPAFHLAVFVKDFFKCACFAPRGYNRFTVLIDGVEDVVWINAKSLKARFKVSNRLLNEAALRDDLMSLVRYHLLEQKLSWGPELYQDIGSDLHLSAKDYTLTEGIYIGKNLLAFGIKKSLIGSGGFAKVKKARMWSGEIVARRICVLNEKNQGRVEKTIQLMEKLKGAPGIIDLLGVVRYKSLKGEQKVVTFHTLYKENLNDLLFKSQTREIPEEMKLSYADQLFKALLSLKGAHGDIKPANIVVDGPRLVLIDLEMHLASDERSTNDLGTPLWVSPELIQDSMKGGKTEIVVNKHDVWATGIILYYLFTYPKINQFSWQQENNIIDLIFAIHQHRIANYIDYSRLSEEKKELLRKMIVVDPQKRCTIQEAAEYFHQKIFAPFKGLH